MRYTAISLFSGIGAFDYAAHHAGFDILAQVEIDDFCRKVLEKHHATYWRNATIFTDVRAFGIAQFPAGRQIDLLYGGFPCQPVSLAGRRLGKDDSRFLWGEFARLIGEFRPRAVLLENVPNITHLEGATVIADLTALGYDAGWGIISAGDAGAPHKRERWWGVAYPHQDRLEARVSATRAYAPDAQRVTAPNLHRQAVHIACGTANTGAIFHRYHKRGYRAQSRLGGNAHGVAHRLDEHRFPARPYEAQHPSEPARLIPSKSPYRAARIGALGNAGLPQIAYALMCEIAIQLDLERSMR